MRKCMTFRIPEIQDIHNDSIGSLIYRSIPNIPAFSCFQFQHIRMKASACPVKELNYSPDRASAHTYADERFILGNDGEHIFQSIRHSLSFPDPDYGQFLLRSHRDSVWSSHGHLQHKTVDSGRQSSEIHLNLIT